MITATLTGFDELVEKTQDSNLIGEPLRTFFNSSLLEVQSNVVQRAKIDTGNLRGQLTQGERREIDSSEIPLWGSFTNNVRYGIFVEEDTGPHWPPQGALAGWAHRHGIPEFVVRRAIARHGTKGAHMFAEGLQASLPAIEQNLQQAALDIEAEWGK